MPDIHLERITKKFGDFTAVNEVSITFPDSSVTCLLGPSGCGKTTLMRMIAGLETPTSGRVRLGNRDVTRLAPSRRNVGMVFQYPVMYPTLSVAQNIELPLLRDRSVSGAERRRRLEQVLDILSMRDLADAFIEDLDAGGRQKVAVGRSVARQTEIILFDEPTTNVEVNAKLELVRAFKEVTRQLKQSIVYVTHDQTEAMTLADQIALMKDGDITQCDSPRELYNNPQTEFGGWFLGNPGMNFVSHTIGEGERWVVLPLFDKPIDAPDGARGAITLGIRPEHIATHAEPVDGSVEALVLSRAVTIGGQQLIKVRVGDIDLKIKANRDVGRQLAKNDTVHIIVPPGRIAFFVDGRRLHADPADALPAPAEPPSEMSIRLAASGATAGSMP